MWAKLLLGALFVSMVALALRVEPARDRSLLATRPSDGPRLKLMTWNVGQASAYGVHRSLLREAGAHALREGGVLRLEARWVHGPA